MKILDVSIFILYNQIRMEKEFSKDALLKFIDFSIDKGLINAQTGKAWRVATLKLLTDLSETEEVDVRVVDVAVAARKLANRDPSALSPNSLTDYRQRVAAAIQEFVSWHSDPAAYKPRGTNGKPRVKQSENGVPPQERKIAPKKATSEPTVKEVPVTSGGLPLAYPLRRDFLAQVVIPRDLKIEEAKRLGAFLLTLASDFSPERL